MKIAFFGTSLTDVNEWQTNSFVQIIEKTYPSARINNFGKGGANSYTVLQIIKELSKNNKYYCVFIEMGTNDIFRKYQNRLDDSVDIEQFIINYENAIDELQAISNHVICISSPPVSADFEYEINPELKKYNIALKNLCLAKDVTFIDIFDKFNINSDLWTDGLHLNEVGDNIIAKEIIKEINR